MACAILGGMGHDLSRNAAFVQRSLLFVVETNYRMVAQKPALRFPSRIACAFWKLESILVTYFYAETEMEVHLIVTLVKSDRVI